MAGLFGVALQAVEVVRKAVEVGDIKVSLEILSGMGLLNGSCPNVGSDDPEELRLQAEREARKAKIAAREEEGMLKLREIVAS